MSDKKRKYATALHPSVEAVINGLYRYKDYAQAKDKLDTLAKHFVLSKEQPDGSDSIVMWIKGFAMSEADEKAGFTGHFAEITISEMPDKKFTLTAQRVDKPIEIHPQKRRVQMRHPNWGHPILRSAKKERVYETIEEAQEELLALHSEFPEVSIPGVGKLFVIVYGKKEGSKKPIHKIALEIQPHRDGKGFILVARDNEKTNAPKLPKRTLPTINSGATSEGPKGYFSSLEIIRKEKKKRKTAIKKPRPDNSETDN